MLFITSAKASELAEKLIELTTQSSAISARMLKIRQIMEQLFKAVTEDAKLSFNGLFARMQYVSNISGMNAGLQMQANKLRILCNEIAHDEISEPSENTFTSSILIVYNLLLFFCPDFIDEVLAQYLFKHGAHAFTPLKENTRKSFLCVVKTWKVLKEGNEDIALEIESVCEDGTACVIMLKNDPKQSGNDGKTYTMLAKSLWQYANLHCYELTEVIGRKGFYQSSHSTLVVLEPDFLIDASALAECFSSSSTNPEYYIINRLITEPSTEAMLQGSVVNSIFDELVFGAEDTYLDLFKHSLANLPVALVAQGKDTVKRIYSKVEADHLPQLKSYIGSLANAEILLEPSFICPEYGLQGRLDLLSKQDDKYSILELKSGKAHPQDIWKGNQMQVIAYNMIIRSVYGANRINNASILYSACKENPLRHVSNVQILEQNLLMCRNRILGILHLLAKEPKVFFDWLIHKTDVPESPFMKQKLERIKSLLSNAEDFQYEWFLAQIQRIISEIWSVKTGNNDNNSDNPYGHNALWQQGKAEKINSYKIVTNLIPTSYDRRMIVLAIPPTDDIADFREGDIVVLYCQNTSIIHQEILRGVIVSLDKSTVRISIRGGLKNSSRFTEDSLWSIEHDILETSLYSPLSSITKFLSSSRQTQKLFLGIDNPLSMPDPGLPEAKSLADTVFMMHSAKDLYIVQGPPGTGKTSGLLGSYVNELFHQDSKKLLILSFTNRAVDEICLCLQRLSISFLRMGSSAVIQDQLLSKQIEGKRFEEMESIILSNRIWIATVQSANAWYQDLLQIVKIDELVIDEASQIIENSILGLISQIPKTILIGDQNQLPPICGQSSQPYRFTNEKLLDLCYGSYHQSLMERLHRVYSQRKINNVSMLHLHYRMHDQIASLISHYYYGKLQSKLPKQTECLQQNPLLPDFLNNRLIWISCLPSQVSNYDPLQVDLIVAAVNKLYNAGDFSDTKSDIGIVAPFRAMIHALHKAMPPAFQGITIDTVERFQGSERETIILCLPLRFADNLKQIESLSDDGSVDRKLNVALSRAKQRIIILGNLSLCRASEHYRRIIQDIENHGIIVDSTSAMKELTKPN